MNTINALLGLYGRLTAERAAIEAAPIGTTVQTGWTRAKLFGRKGRLVLQYLLEE